MNSYLIFGYIQIDNSILKFDSKKYLMIINFVLIFSMNKSFMSLLSKYFVLLLMENLIQSWKEIQGLSWVFFEE